MWHIVARTLPSLLLQHWLLRIEWHGCYIVGHQPLLLSTLLWVCVQCVMPYLKLPLEYHSFTCRYIRHLASHYPPLSKICVFSLPLGNNSYFFFWNVTTPISPWGVNITPPFWGCIGFYVFPSKVFKRPNIWVHSDKAGSFWSSSWCYQSPLEFWSYPLGSTWSHLGWS